MKLEFLSFEFDKFAKEMQNLKEKKGFDYLVTIVGEDFGAEEGLGCIYILENTSTHERCSVKMMAKTQVCGDGIASNGTGDTDGQKIPYIPTVSNIWRVADLLEREVYDFYGIVFLGHPDMRRLFLRSDFKGYPFRKDWKFDDHYSLEDDVEPDYGLEYYLDNDGCLQSKQNKLFTSDDYVINIGPQHPATHGVLRLQTVLEGEVVKRIYPHFGYIHRGIEKMWEGMTYPQTLALTDRLNYLGAMQTAMPWWASSRRPWAWNSPTASSTSAPSWTSCSVSTRTCSSPRAWLRTWALSPPSSMACATVSTCST